MDFLEFVWGSLVGNDSSLIGHNKVLQMMYQQNDTMPNWNNLFRKESLMVVLKTSDV